MKRKVVGWALAAGVLMLPPCPVSAVDPGLDPPGMASAVVSYATGGELTTDCMEGTFEMLAVQPGETLQVRVQYPSDHALQIVDLTALDGGILLPPTVGVEPTYTPTPTPIPRPDTSPVPTPPTLEPQDMYVPGAGLSLAIEADGTLSFTFVVGLEPGLRQISLRQGDQELGFLVWVNDPNNPDSNPPALGPTAPNPL